MADAANYKRVLNNCKSKSHEVQMYFPHFERLVIEFSWDVSISYVFAILERAKHMTVYCGIIKLHNTEKTLTRTLVDKDHMSRGRFRELFKIVFGKEIEKCLLQKLSEAEKIRDKIVHGKDWTAEEARRALVDVFEFAEGFNNFVNELAGFKPIGGELRGLKGAKASLSKETSRWVLRGMGIGIEKNEPVRVPSCPKAT
ncbi:MAG: hypothetical protein H5U13_04625 [Parvibaculum sp.]|nr:hypothetical protein [Parvibaculum sp.]